MNPKSDSGTGERHARDSKSGEGSDTLGSTGSNCSAVAEVWRDGRAEGLAVIRAGTRPPGGPYRQRRRAGLTGLDPQTDAPSRLLSLAGAASYLALSWWTTRELVMSGTIPAVRLPAPRARDGRLLRRILVDRADLDALIVKWKDVT